MKALKFLPFIIIFLITAHALPAQQLKSPESIVYDTTGKRYYISNAGNGDIMSFNSKSQCSTFISGKDQMESPKGMVIAKDMLYVVDKTKVLVFNASNGSSVSEITIPGSQGLNDICFDGKDTLFISDLTGNRLYMVDCTNENIDLIILKDTLAALDKPNGLMYDAENRGVIIVSYIDNSPIVRLRLNTMTLDTLAPTSISRMDGITKDNSDGYYISSWGNEQPGSGKIYRFKKDFSGNPILIASGLSGPADLYYNTLNDTLAIPNFLNNTITFIDLKAPASPLLTVPANNAVDVSVKPIFKWAKSPGVDYIINISKDATFTSEKMEIQVNSSVTNEDSLKLLTPLDSGANYYWRMKSKKNYLESDWSPVWTFKTVEATSVEDFLSAQGLINIIPNPVTDISLIEFDLSRAGDYEISLYNLIGTNKIILSSGYLNQGKHSIKINASGFFNGIYILEVKNNKQSTYKKLVICK